LGVPIKNVGTFGVSMENSGFPRENLGLRMENLGFPRENLVFLMEILGILGFPPEKLGYLGFPQIIWCFH